MTVYAFLLGVIATCSLTASLFFLKFWRRTRSPLFIALAAAFFIEALNRLRTLFIAKPNEGSPSIYVVRLFAFLLILSGILYENYGTGRK